MILPYIVEILSVIEQPENKEAVTAEIKHLDNTINISLLIKKHDEESYEMKYLKYKNLLEKERFERELIAGNR